jgi:O-antigen ligase
VWAFILALHVHERKPWDYVVMGFMFATLILSQSRSGMIVFFIVAVMTARRVPLGYIIAGLVAFGATLFLAPHSFWRRMIRSVTFVEGSFEVYSGWVRLYGYIASIRIFLDNWLVGVGYLGGRFLSDRYNSLRVSGLGSENVYLEAAVSMGVIGLAIMAMTVLRLFQLGRVVRRVAPPGTIAHDLSRFHFPLILALGLFNMVGDHWAGMVGVGHIAVWCAVLVRAGHLSLARRPA